MGLLIGIQYLLSSIITIIESALRDRIYWGKQHMDSWPAPFVKQFSHSHLFIAIFYILDKLLHC